MTVDGSKTILESLLIDERDERVNMVSGLVYFGSATSRDIAKLLFEVKEALEKGDAAKAIALVNDALPKIAALHTSMHDNLKQLLDYAQRKRPKANAANLQS